MPPKPPQSLQSGEPPHPGCKVREDTRIDSSDSQLQHDICDESAFVIVMSLCAIFKGRGDPAHGTASVVISQKGDTTAT